jgi:hypothetical protein
MFYTSGLVGEALYLTCHCFRESHTPSQFKNDIKQNSCVQREQQKTN